MLLRTFSLMVMARLLLPADFGLVGMVTAVTGVIALVRDAGLGTVVVQRSTISDKELSTLFWMNIVVGVLLCGISMATAPFIVAFFDDSRLYSITFALSAGFVINAAASQHQALLQRQLRSVTMGVVDTLAWLVSIAVGIVMAISGFSYWSLVASTLVFQATILIGVWYATAWVPGVPSRNVGARSMLRFGGVVTLNNIVSYIAYNLDKVFLGRFWGAEALGYYGRAYQLINVPTQQLNYAVGWIAFPALSKIQEDQYRINKYFLKGYSLVLGLTIPITIACGLFAEDIILALFGPKWKDAIDVFRLFAPSVLAIAMINPFGWLLFSTGKVMRSLKIALVFAPLLIGAYLLGLPYGPVGVASGFSIMMLVKIIPVIAWAKHGSGISSRDVLDAVKPPLFAGILAGVCGFVAKTSVLMQLPLYQRFIVEHLLLFSVYAFILFFLTKQRELYLTVYRELRGRSYP